MTVVIFLAGGGVLTLANCITMLRILAVPLFLYLFFGPRETNAYWAALLFVFTGITDVLDGYLARSRQEVSTFGTLADPLADKLIMLAAVISLVVVGKLPLWVATILILKELALVIGAGVFLVSKRKVVSASVLGKGATLLLYIGVTGLILGISWAVYVVVLGVGLSLMAGLDYLHRAMAREE